MGEERRAHLETRSESGGCLCVVLAGAGTSRPVELLHGLEKRGAEVRLVDHPTGVMVELAAGARAVIVNEPTRVSRLPRLLAAVRRYYPAAVCWQFTQSGRDGEPELSRISMNGAASPSPLVGEGGRLRRPGEGSAGKSEEVPIAKVAMSEPTVDWGIPPHPSPLPAGERGQEKPGSPVITPEELAMLLAPLPERAEDWATPPEDGLEDEE